MLACSAGSAGREIFAGQTLDRRQDDLSRLFLSQAHRPSVSAPVVDTPLACHLSVFLLALNELREK